MVAYVVCLLHAAFNCWSECVYPILNAIKVWSELHVLCGVTEEKVAVYWEGGGLQRIEFLQLCFQVLSSMQLLLR